MFTKCQHKKVKTHTIHIIQHAISKTTSPRFSWFLRKIPFIDKILNKKFQLEEHKIWCFCHSCIWKLNSWTSTGVREMLSTEGVKVYTHIAVANFPQELHKSTQFQFIAIFWRFDAIPESPNWRMFPNGYTDVNGPPICGWSTFFSFQNDFFCIEMLDKSKRKSDRICAGPWITSE